MSIYPENYHKQFSAARRMAVNAIVQAMETDYGKAFMSQFKNNDSVDDNKLRQWKFRLLDFASPFTDEQLLNAVDECCKRSREFPPNLREIQSAMRELHSIERERQRQAEVLQRERTPVNQENVDRITQAFKNAVDLSGSNAIPSTAADAAEKLDYLRKKREQYHAHEMMILAHCNDKSFPLTRAIDEKIRHLQQTGGLVEHVRR